MQARDCLWTIKISHPSQSVRKQIARGGRTFPGGSFAGPHVILTTRLFVPPHNTPGGSGGERKEISDSEKASELEIPHDMLK